MTQAILVGAGPVGVTAMASALEDGLLSRCTHVVDPDVERRTVAAEPFQATPVLDIDVLEPSDGDIALATFSSSAEAVGSASIKLMRIGYDVVTTCEELAAPLEATIRELSAVAGAEGRRVVVTGANPGFVMDRLPLVLASGVRNVTSVSVVRRLDTNKRRGPLVSKSGKGLTAEEFRARAASGQIGHVGLDASLRLVGRGLGWPEAPVVSKIEPVLDEGGLVAGQFQSATLTVSGRRIEYRLTMASDVANPVDEIVIEGDPPIHMELRGGYHGDLGTTARVLAAIRSIGSLAPGFYTPVDLPIGS